ncbi:AhpC/TSA family protein [Pedobacter frigidisoli]|uniref:AhpC/TSA family protein n=1 Tax=Pedobacter frigidisoli TaxID=2530455 RepID=A0A4V2MMZ6_9SPHI|nr:TlpA disulfide reductase family protein [Pedobacter frigidisoli]TCD10728.1 AhpC/TSA family protein [Pedobacter frigidisoli]
MKILLYLLLLFSFIETFPQQSDRFTLNGTTNLKDGEKISFRYNGVNDSTTVLNGQFYFNGPLEEPTFAVLIHRETNLMEGPKSIRFFIEPTQMKIAALDGQFIKARISGSEIQKTLEELRLKEAIDKVDDALSYWEKEIRKQGDSELSKAKVDSLRKQKSIIINSAEKLQLDYVRHSPESYLSPYLLFAGKLSLDSMRFFYNSFSPLVKNSVWGRVVHKNLGYADLSKVGQPAVNFSAKLLDGSVLNLSSFKDNKYVLLDFWGTWCVKCRKLSPDLIEIYRKLNAKGLEIISIASDRDVKVWKKVIGVDQTGLWKHMLLKDAIFDHPADDLINQYSISGYPTFILIDKEGKIAGRYDGAGDEFHVDLKNKLKEIFE